MDRKLKYMSLLALLIILYFSCDDKKKRINHNINFRQQMVKALDLKFINMDSCYYDSRTRIFNDTIVGFYTNFHKETYDDASGNYFFVQSLNNLRNKKTFNPDISTPTFIDVLKNGKLYAGEFGRSFMISVDTNGVVREYFKKYHDTMFYANKVMLYKNRTAILSMNGLFVFDTDEQKLLWKHKFSKAVEISDASLINGKLIFHECKEDTLIGERRGFVHCIDLDRLSVLWSYNIKNECFGGQSGYYQESNYLASRMDELIIWSNKVVRALDLNNGAVKHQSSKFRSVLFTKVLDLTDGTVKHQSSKFRTLLFDYGGKGYYGDTDSGAVYLDSNFQIQWQLNGINTHSIYKENFIGTTRDREYYVIVDKKNGKLKYKIRNNYPSEGSFHTIDGYIMIDNFYLYK